MSEGDAVFVRAPDVVARRIAGETVLVPLRSRSPNATTRVADFYVLNETAERLWEMLSSARDVSSLAQELIRTYEVPPDQATADVRAFIRDMLEVGAIVQPERA